MALSSALAFFSAALAAFRSSLAILKASFLASAFLSFSRRRTSISLMYSLGGRNAWLCCWRFFSDAVWVSAVAESDRRWWSFRAWVEMGFRRRCRESDIWLKDHHWNLVTAAASDSCLLVIVFRTSKYSIPVFVRADQVVDLVSRDMPVIGTSDCKEQGPIPNTITEMMLQCITDNLTYLITLDKSYNSEPRGQPGEVARLSPVLA
nr:hypothetical protein Iba_chr14aCG23250 [Ipomoea batatas]